MSVTTTVVFRGIAHSAALEANIRARAERLERFAADIQSCRVIIDLDGRRHLHGARYLVKIHVHAPGRQIDIGAAHAHDPGHTDPYVAVADAFEAMHRCLEESTDRKHGHA